MLALSLTVSGVCLLIFVGLAAVLVRTRRAVERTVAELAVVSVDCREAVQRARVTVARVVP